MNPRKGRLANGEFTVIKLSMLAEKAPDAYQEFMAQKLAERRYQVRMAWVGLIAKIVGNISGVTSLAILAWVAWHAIDRGAASEGVAILCTSVVAMVAIYITSITGLLSGVPSKILLARRQRSRIRRLMRSRPATTKRQDFLGGVAALMDFRGHVISQLPESTPMQDLADVWADIQTTLASLPLPGPEASHQVRQAPGPTAEET